MVLELLLPVTLLPAPTAYTMLLLVPPMVLFEPRARRLALPTPGPNVLPLPTATEAVAATLLPTPRAVEPEAPTALLEPKAEASCAMAAIVLP
ncbi:hypothetical protein DWF00_04245 [Bosea caraganae]|uniref:Uncharacterized protein n=1 Tax=Bosea caraganae TaxID=2763117 RepID=A0A370KXY0_9HYPH|nr:hypothetical protein DWE98_27875 [Bosea caraganae]RDJ30063.1 hypothetical protein DWF00_04245 [Bosea caraganae]